MAVYGILGSMRNLLSTALFVLFASPAFGNSFVYFVNGAEADIQTSNGLITITLYDRVINPGADTGNLSAFIFTTSVAPGASSISSSSGIERTITGTGAGQYSDAVSPVPAGWALTVSSATTTL